GMEELLRTEDGSTALVFHLAPERIGAILLEEARGLRADAPAALTGERLAIGVGDGLLGRVVDPLGRPLDGGARPRVAERRPLEGPSPRILARDFVNKPLYTGNRIADSMIPIGHGQRQLLIGDNGTGKTSFALDTVLAQKGRGVSCVYVLIGQKRSTVAAVIETLRAGGALEYSALVVAEATAMPGLKYLAPFAGCAIAEAWMEAGRQTLVVYDDLSTHARIYRELSLLLRRPPGREAYPGDVFFLHSRLLERSTCLDTAHGGGSMTALPIVETEQGEIAAYIPTNLISITDGQVYFDRRMFAAGQLPAIDVRRSVSRIGGKAQPAAIKREAASMKLDYLQFLELEMFSRFGSRLEAGLQARLARGRLLRRVLKQEPLQPLAPECQLAWLVAFNDRRLEGLDDKALDAALEQLFAGARAGTLSLDDARESWSAAVAGWVGGERA
ncbi:MAG TPA: F0F1 ATP synthase subunit alpha, partial [Burkholderiales bacterium]|nr:F0F1 ATP synthase subunit alpha [Burkholderiales bacterium]